MPLPQLLYAQVVKTVRRRRLVRVRHRIVFGTREAIQQVLAACGWQINTAFVERVNLTIRQHVAAVRRRVSTLCKGEDGLRQQLSLYHVYYNFCLPHASVRQPLLPPEPTHGTGSAKCWQLRTPAMAAGLTDHVWTLRECCCFGCRRGRSQRRGEHAVVVGNGNGRGLRWRRVPARPPSRASPGVKGPLGCHESPLF